MGSSLSLQSRDKRRRSNRLSKPPQNQGIIPHSPILCSPRQPAEQAVSLPTTPTAWRNPWTSAPVPADPGDIVANNLRSQSLSSKPLQRQTTRQSNTHLVGKRRINSTASLWPQSPTSPTSTPSRQCSVYGRSSFHLPETTTFQPTTLQTNPQSPLTGQPRRSYSVRHRSQRARDGVQQRTLDRFVSISSHSRVKSLDTLPIRRRTILMRPGVATRNATITMPPTFYPEPYQEDIISDDPGGRSFDPTLPRYLARRTVYFDEAEQPLSQLLPATPNDSGYTHLGTLRLGSLRVVNGSTSPCPSDRTRLSHADASTPEAESGNQDSTELQKEKHALRPTSSDGLSVETEYHSLHENTRVVDYASETEPEPQHQNISDHPVSSRNDTRTTKLKIPSCDTARGDVDFPTSPFSFAKSPTTIPGHMIELREAEDEGISVRNDGTALRSLPEKIPERHLSYSSCASSHRRADSGYSSAASHRNSIDSHASIQRSPGFRRLFMAGSPGECDLRDMNVPFRAGNQHPMDRHLSLQDRKMNLRLNVHEHSSSSVGEPGGQLQLMAGRPRGSSLPVPGMLAIPQYCAQLRNLESTSLALRSATLQMGSSAAFHIDESVCLNRGPESSAPDAATSSPVNGYYLAEQAHQGTGSSDSKPYTYSGPPVLLQGRTCSMGPCQGTSEDGSSQEVRPVFAARHYRRHSSGVKPDAWFSFFGDSSYDPLSAEQSSNRFANETLRGRTRSQSIGYQHYNARAATSEPL